jgi:hypothetical protein
MLYQLLLCDACGHKATGENCRAKRLNSGSVQAHEGDSERRFENILYKKGGGESLTATNVL